MSQFLSLEDAARSLGISTDRLVELRSQGKIRGFRDGTSWKFPETELARLADDLAGGSGEYDPFAGFDQELSEEDSDDFTGAIAGGSGVLVDDPGTGSGRGSKIIGGDASDIGIGAEALVRSGSDVNLIPGGKDGSDVKVVTGGSAAGDSDDFLISGGREGLIEIDSGELKLSPDEPVISHDSEVLDLAIEPNAGSTGPITDKELKEVADRNPDLLVGKKPLSSDSGLAFDQDDEDSDDDLIGVQSEDDLLGADLELETPTAKSGGSSRGSMSSLEMLDDLDMQNALDKASGDSLLSGRSSRGIDVLSELDLLSADAGGSGLITGDSGQVLGSNLGSKSSGSGKRGSGLAFDDALGDDDDLVIADDEDDLVLGSGASDVSVSGDSGINLMSPSDSGLSLESEPLDLAGSSISALDLGAEFATGGGSSGIGGASGLSGPASSKRGSGIQAGADEDFRLSPSGVGADLADDSSQVIEIEDSSAFADADAFGDAGFGEEAAVDAGFGGDGLADAEMVEAEDDQAFGAAPVGSAGRARPGAAPVYEVPFTVFQVSMLLVTLMFMSVGGMLMTDLMRNMWAYTDTAAPVSSLTDSLVSLANLDG